MLSIRPYFDICIHFLMYGQLHGDTCEAASLVTSIKLVGAKRQHA